MGKDTSIAWTDSTLNLAWGCTKVSAGCENCYMFRLSKQFGRNPETVTILKSGKDLGYMSKNIAGLGERIFVNSMSDTFHESIELSLVAKWFKLFAAFDNKQFQVLTKRINRARAFSKGIRHDGGWPTNVWLGTSVEDESHLFRIKTLQITEGPKIKFVSFEPLLGPIPKPDLEGIDWIIIGGESGDNPRPMQAGWAEDLIDYTRINYPKCAIFFKQLGGRGRDGAGGSVLNGKTIQELPNYR